jgi:hypothetical protein
MCHSPKHICWDQTLFYSKQNKREQKEKIKMLQEKHIAYEAIKI